MKSKHDTISEEFSGKIFTFCDTWDRIHWLPYFVYEKNISDRLFVWRVSSLCNDRHNRLQLKAFANVSTNHRSFDWFILSLALWNAAVMSGRLSYHFTATPRLLRCLLERDAWKLKQRPLKRPLKVRASVSTADTRSDRNKSAKVIAMCNAGLQTVWHNGRESFLITVNSWRVCFNYSCYQRHNSPALHNW